MRRWRMPSLLPVAGALLVALSAANPALAQRPESDWVEQLVDGSLNDWMIDEGESRKEGKTLILGGKSATKIRLTTPLGDQFKIHLECTFQGDRPTLRWNAPGEAERVWSIQGIPGATTEVKVTGAQGGWSRTYRLSYSYDSRGSTGSSSGSGGLASGNGTIETFRIMVPAGSTLTLRRVALQTTPPVVAATGGLAVALGVLAAVLGGIMLLGWHLNRLRTQRFASSN